jgi:hypothetical protein
VFAGARHSLSRPRGWRKDHGIKEVDARKKKPKRFRYVVRKIHFLCGLEPAAILALLALDFLGVLIRARHAKRNGGARTSEGGKRNEENYWRTSLAQAELLARRELLAQPAFGLAMSSATEEPGPAKEENAKKKIIGGN